MGERRQVARRAEAAARWDDRVDGRVEHADEQLDDVDADAGEPDRERVGTQQEHRAHDLVGQRVADAGRVRADQVALQLGGLVRLDAHVGEVAEAGRDAVDGGPLGHEPLDDRARRAHPLARRPGRATTARRPRATSITLSIVRSRPVSGSGGIGPYTTHRATAAGPHEPPRR